MIYYACCVQPVIILLCRNQGFNQMGVQASCGRHLFKENCFVFHMLLHKFVGGAVASWLVRSTPEQALQVRALAGDIVLCS